MVGAEEVRGEENAPGLLQVATVELVLDWRETNVEDILLLGGKMLSKHTVITTLNQKKQVDTVKLKYTAALWEKLLLRWKMMSKVTKKGQPRQ